MFKLVEDLTEREIEVLQMLAWGLSNPQIADRLVVTRSTVKFHVCNILSKLCVSNRTAAVLAGIRLGLVQDSGDLWGENEG